jgi:hypothetical protein
MILASCAFRKKAPNSASAANAAMSFRMVHVMWMVLFSLIGSPLCGRLPRKKVAFCLAACFQGGEVRGIRVNVQDHVRGTILDDSIWVSPHIIKELVYLFHCVFSWC